MEMARELGRPRTLRVPSYQYRAWWEQVLAAGLRRFPIMLHIRFVSDGWKDELSQTVCPFRSCDRRSPTLTIRQMAIGGACGPVGHFS